MCAGYEAEMTDPLMESTALDNYGRLTQITYADGAFFSHNRGNLTLKGGRGLCIHRHDAFKHF